MTQKPLFFKNQNEFRKWLHKNHDKKTEVIVGFYKVGTGKATLTWSEAVDQAICYGWIDGIRHSIDSESYSNRFTPRKPKSNWSAINIKKVEDLSRQGLMHAAGLAAFQKREEARSRIYSYEKNPSKLSSKQLKQFKANKKAWAYFQSMSKSYQNTAIHWVTSAKQEVTVLKRLQTLIADSEEERKIKPLNYSKKKNKA